MTNTRTIVVMLAFVFGSMVVSRQVCGEVSTKTSSFYVIKIETSTKDAKNLARITVTGKGGYHCNMLYPWKLKLKPGDGIAFDKAVYRKKDTEKFTKEEVVFAVSYTAKPGAQLLADLKLSVCNDKQCQIETASLTI